MISLKEVVNKSLSITSDAPRNYIGASSIGNKCNRAIWYGYKGYKADIEPRMKLLFKTGHALEKLLIDHLISPDILVKRPSHTNNFLSCQDKDIPEFIGHMDLIITSLIDNFRAVVDIKTCKASSFAQFVNKGLIAWNYSYYLQLQSYMGMTGIKKACLLAINKDSSELHEEWIHYDDIVYGELKAKAKFIRDHEGIPKRINDSAAFYLCKMCNYRKECFLTKEE